MLPRSLRAELVADEGDEGDVIAAFLADLLEQGVHRDVGILNNSLVQTAGGSTAIPFRNKEVGTVSYTHLQGACHNV